MNKRSDSDSTSDELYERIIGLGEKSIRKSYYPLLREKISELEKANTALETEIIERRNKEEELHRNHEHLNLINNLLKLSLKQIPLPELVRITVDHIQALTWIRKMGSASIYLDENRQDGHSSPNSSEPASQQIIRNCTKIHFGKCRCNLAAKSELTRYISSDREPPSCETCMVQDHSNYCVPIRLEHQTLGMICIRLPGDHPYEPREEETLVSIANTFAGILQRKRMSDEKDKLEQHLRQTQKMEAIGTLSGGIAHDFNNILSPIIGFAELARLKLSDDNPAVRDIEHVINAGNRAKELVKQILALSRQTKFELKPIQVHTVLKEALKLLRSTIPTTIDIKTRIDESETTVLADSTQIHQIVMNLCTNAYHAMRSTGGILNIVLETRSVTHSEDHPPNILPGEYIVLSVQDTGMGMTRSIMEKIFDPYFTTKNKDEGTGLGLSVIQGIVTSYGGQITVSSELGIGSCFEVYLPGMTSEQAIRTDEHSIPLPGGSEHILVVDDEEAIASMITSMLRNKGYTVTACTNSTDALRTFRDRHTDFSLVITDMTMPQMTGVELARRMIDFRPDIPLILCTGFSEMIDEKKAEMLGFCKYLMKPVNMKDLYLSVRETIDRSQLAGEGGRVPASA